MEHGRKITTIAVALKEAWQRETLGPFHRASQTRTGAEEKVRELAVSVAYRDLVFSWPFSSRICSCFCKSVFEEDKHITLDLWWNACTTQYMRNELERTYDQIPAKALNAHISCRTFAFYIA